MNNLFIIVLCVHSDNDEAPYDKGTPLAEAIEYYLRSNQYFHV